MKSYAKLNIFLKIVGTRGSYHEISSRFVLWRQLFDELNFEPADKFELECKHKGQNLEIENNIVLKAFKALGEAGYAHELDEFFSSHKIVLHKNIPMGAGLGGGSSNAAAFLNLANETLNLGISRERLCEIGARVGADVPFFVSGLNAANVSRIGEVIAPFDDELPALEVITPEIFCSTPAVYGEFRANFMHTISPDLAREMSKMTSQKLLETYKNSELNDLYAPCFRIYADLAKFKDMYLSGSGSSVFCLK